MMESDKINIELPHLGIGDNFPVCIMGVINISEESFYRRSFVKTDAIATIAQRMIAHHAAILDIGGRSTAPHARAITSEEEKKRIGSALKALFSECDCAQTYISIDTQYRDVAETAFSVMQEYGKEDFFILNDVSGLKTDKSLCHWIREVDKPVIVMATHQQPGDSLGIEQTIADLTESLEMLEAGGIDTASKAIVDPGIGRWISEKEPHYDLELLGHLEKFRVLKKPILVGISRKSFIGAVLDKKDPALRLQGTLAATAIAVYNGAHIIRTHDVIEETIDTIRIASAVRKQRMS
jgi:dihydropteroate synthase